MQCNTKQSRANNAKTKKGQRAVQSTGPVQLVPSLNSVATEINPDVAITSKRGHRDGFNS